MAQHFNVDTQRWESVRVSSYALEEFGDVRVDEVMARDLVSVQRETSVVDVARTMIEANVHRVLVLDQMQQLYGIIAAVDFVRLFAEQAK
jgi:predicted transcriptional regulator